MNFLLKKRNIILRCLDDWFFSNEFDIEASVSRGNKHTNEKVALLKIHYLKNIIFKSKVFHGRNCWFNFQGRNICMQSIIVSGIIEKYKLRNDCWHSGENKLNNLYSASAVLLTIIDL